MLYAHKITGIHPIRLKDFNPSDNAGLNREEGEEKLVRLCDELTRLQELLYAASDHSVLVVLQGRDTSGKDGTIKAVMGPLNSLGCNVASFKVPTEKELAHDFLWRVHHHTPAKGEITIFKKWFRNLAVAEAIVAALKPFERDWLKKPGEIGRREKALIEEFRNSQRTEK